MQSFDVVVIGAGPAGYIAAIRAAQLGLSTACIDNWKEPDGKYALGGTCLNVGCIPSKALLESSENYERVQHRFKVHGISATGVKLDLAAMLERKDKIVKKMTGGIAGLFKKNKVTWLQGHGRLMQGGTTWKLEVKGDKGAETVEAKNVIIATGSKPRHLPGVPVDNKLVCDNEGALAFDAVPGRLGVIGAGVIGLELGSVWRRLGAKVKILEALPDFLGAADQAIAQEAWKIFTAEQALEIELGVKIGDVKQSKKGVTVQYTTSDNSSKTLDCDRLVVSIGRVPNSDGLGAENVGLKIDSRGFIEVDKNCRTALPRVYAIGDVVRGPDAGAQGRGRGRDGGRDHRRPARARELRRHSVGDLHRARDRLGRQDRAAAEGGGRRLPRRASSPSPTTAARSGATSPRASSRCSPTPRPTASSACT